MIRRSTRRALARLCLGVAGLAGLVPGASADVDFEGVAPSLYAAGDTFQLNGFRLSVVTGFGVVDTAAAFAIATPPTGNDTQFYGGLNDGRLRVETVSGEPFSLAGFDAGFVGPFPVEPGVVAGRIVLLGETLSGAALTSSWELAPSQADGSFSFLTYAAPADFAGFGLLRSVTFLACIYDGAGCFNPADNLAQYGLDNLRVQAIPEPETLVLLLAGLGLLGARRLGRGERA